MISPPQGVRLSGMKSLWNIILQDIPHPLLGWGILNKDYLLLYDDLPHRGEIINKY